MTYHVSNIPKGKIGELSKIYEEIEEVKDADQQGCSIMLLLELSDTVGAIECFLEKYHPSITVLDLISMKNITKRAFKSGDRT